MCLTRVNMHSESLTICRNEARILAAAYGVIMVFGSFSNAVVATTYMKWRRTMLKEPRDILVFSLAIGDFVMTSCVCPFGFASAVMAKWTTGYSGCVWYGFVSTWVGLSSMLQLAAIAVERYGTLSHSFSNPVSQKRAVQFTLSAWVVSCAVSCFPLFGWSEYTFEGFRLYCSIHWSSKDIENGSFNLLLLVFFFAIPVALIGFSYIKIFFIVRRMSASAAAMWGSQAQGTRESFMGEVKIAKQLALVTGGFLFAWTPYAVMSLLVAFTGFKPSTGIHALPALFAKTSNIYNPIIYFFTYKRLSRKALQMFKNIRSRSSSNSGNSIPNEPREAARMIKCVNNCSRLQTQD